MEEDMRGRGIQKRGLFLKFGGRRKHYWRLEIVFLGWYFLVLEFGWTVTGVHQVARSFGLGGQESSWNLGAGEPDKLCS
jgi:hypothetical protein